MYCRMKIFLKKDYYKIGKLSASLYLLNERQVGKISPLKRSHIESARHTLNHLLCCYEFSPRKKSHNYVLWQLWNGAALNVFMLPSLLILDIIFFLSFYIFHSAKIFDKPSTRDYNLFPSITTANIRYFRTVCIQWKAEETISIRQGK